MNKQAVLFFLLNFLICFTMNAQHMDLSELGIRFDIPQGWTGEEQGDYLLLGHQTVSGLMIVGQNSSKDASALKNKLLEPISEEGLFLEPDGDFTTVSSTRVEGYYKGTYQSQAVQAFTIGLVNEHGVGMTILMLTSSDVFGDIHREAAKKLARSVQLFQPKESDNTSFWRQRIVGSQLKFMHTSGGSDYSGGYSGTSDVVAINLCTNGRFTYYSNASASFDGSGGSGHAVNNAANQGVYKIYSKGNATYLDLQFDAGNTNTYELLVSSEEHTLLNGNRYFITTLEGCY